LVPITAGTKQIQNNYNTKETNAFSIFYANTYIHIIYINISINTENTEIK